MLFLTRARLGAEILRYYSLGNPATAIQGLLPAHPPPPPLDYIQQVIDRQRRTTRAGLPQYEALHLMCRDYLAERHLPVVSPLESNGKLLLHIGAAAELDELAPLLSLVKSTPSPSGRSEFSTAYFVNLEDYR